MSGPAHHPSHQSTIQHLGNGCFDCPRPVAPCPGRFTGGATDAATSRPAAYILVAALAAGSFPAAGTAGGGDGQFVLARLPAGTYTMRVSAVGSRPLLRAEVVVPASGTMVLGRLLLAATD